VLRTLFSLAIDSDTNVAPVKAMARQALFHVASTNTPLFISTLICDTMNTKKPAEKKGYLRLVSLFIKKMPLVLYSSLPKVVEAVVKSLDPNVPNMRETVLQTSTGILHDLVKTFPSISFHGPSQKLAVGTLEGATVVYDLRTATQCQVLEVRFDDILYCIKNCVMNGVKYVGIYYLLCHLCDWEKWEKLIRYDM